MGYPMYWGRLVRRNGLTGGYREPGCQPGEPDYWLGRLRLVAGDMRRVETDQRDERHLAEYARRAGVTTEQARAVLDAFFEGDF
jgi:hypothetical protein